MTSLPDVRKVLRVFLASPGDLHSERSAMERIVGEMNRTIAKDLGWVIDLVRWEEMLPAAGRPQQVILDQADFNSLDAFVGVLWNRFGSPTGKAASGTEEEFVNAMKLWEEFGKPQIHLYFCQRPANLATSDDLAQKSLVLAFRERVSQRLLHKEFSSETEFVESIRHVLTRHLLLISQLGHSPPTWSSGAGRAGTSVHGEPWITIPRGVALIGPAKVPVQVDYDFQIRAVPVTNQDFLAFVEATGYWADALGLPRLEVLAARAREKPVHPVTNVSWHEASAYAAWLGARLPTSLEWEKAARGPAGLMYPWGEMFDSNRCNSAEGAHASTTSVWAFPEGRSPYGCWDMVGNVFEWCLDWAVSPRFSSRPNSEKLNRGGSFNRQANQLVTWYDESDPPDLRMGDVGFRCARGGSPGL